ERWAVAHYVQNEFLPKERVETMTDKQLEDVCMGLSKPPKPPALPVEFAMQLLVEESNSRRNTRMTSYGAVKLNDDGDKNHGAMVWKSACSSCHGPSGQGNADLGHYGRFPYVALSARTLQNEAAGGTWDTFVARVDGAHATIPSMTPTAWLDDRDWKSLQAYMSGMKGSAQVTTDRPPPKPPALLSVEPTYELFMRDDKVFKLANPEEEGQSATVTEITDYATFREAYKPILVAEGETMEPLPEAQPADGVKVRVAVEMACVGTTNGCGADALKAEEGKTIATGERTIMFK
ncbi:MAG: cytochrome c, partial [Myxococcota bacterium]